ncbi:F-box associated domain [Trema orientale]|uniref:F-box associated domain n=1 Tax=Trema orientale TaxID=63057 RepID=A0A2P5BEG0_TREOI|nr:F-box associated domain [Trema orientale]
MTEDFDLPVISDEPDMSCLLGCHCNGIVCLADYGKTLVLCNPAIMEYKALPEPCHSEYDFVTLGVGLGYDSRANDYKVVKFGGRKFQPGWSEHLKAEYVIISFDMFDEVFRRISLPDNLQTQQCIKLAVWNESLALFLYPGERGAPISIEVWVMDDCFGGVKGSCSWTKKLTIGPLDGIATPWTFWKNDELLIEAIDGGLLSYNLCSHMLRTLGGVESIRRWDFSYVRSLVSVHGGNQAHW